MRWKCTKTLTFQLQREHQLRPVRAWRERPKTVFRARQTTIRLQTLRQRPLRLLPLRLLRPSGLRGRRACATPVHVYRGTRHPIRWGPRNILLVDCDRLVILLHVYVPVGLVFYDGGGSLRDLV